GKKAPDNPDLKRWMELADQRLPLWAAGKVDERVRQGMVRATNGQLSSGPVAVALAVDPTKGAKLELAAVMANPTDAKALESFANTQKGLLAYAAQAKQMGPIVDKLGVLADRDVVRFKIDLSIDDVNQLISALDDRGSTGSGSGSGS